MTTIFFPYNKKFAKCLVASLDFLYEQIFPVSNNHKVKILFIKDVFDDYVGR